MQITTEQIVQASAIISFFLPLVAGAVLSLIKVVEAHLSPAQAAKTKVTLEAVDAELARAKVLITQVVTAVQQTSASDPGQNKKVQVEALTSNLLAEYNVHISPAMIDILIEAAVHGLAATRMAATTQLIPAVR